MQYADYVNEVMSDAHTWIDESQDQYDDDFNSLFTDLARDVTGLASGSHTCNAREAEDNLLGVIFDGHVLDLLQRYYGYECFPMHLDAEYVDCLIRQLVLLEHEGDLNNYWSTYHTWACPDCSDQYTDDYVILDHDDDCWTCPRCGCSTEHPTEDACYMIEE